MLASQEKYILVVDDLVDNLFLLKTVLELEGYVVEVASSGRVALEKIAATPPDLLLLDVMMPDMTGYEVAQHVRQSDRAATIPILLITAHDEAIAHKGLAAGANDYIRKPINFDELLARVRAYAA